MEEKMAEPSPLSNSTSAVKSESKEHSHSQPSTPKVVEKPTTSSTTTSSPPTTPKTRSDRDFKRVNSSPQINFVHKRGESFSGPLQPASNTSLALSNGAVSTSGSSISWSKKEPTQSTTTTTTTSPQPASRSTESNNPSFMERLFSRRSKTLKFNTNQSTTEELLKVAFHQESENSAKLRAEVSELNKELKKELKAKSQLEKKVKQLEKNYENAKSLLKGSEGLLQVQKEAEDSRRENRVIQKDLKKTKKEVKKLQKDLKKMKEDWDADNEKNRLKLEKLQEEKNAFEKQCASLQLAKLNQNFKDKTPQQIEGEARTIFHKQIDLLSIHKDLPRLAFRMDFIDMEGNVVVRGSQDISINQNIINILLAATRRLDGNELADKLATVIPEYLAPSDDRDPIKALLKLLKEQFTEQDKIIRCLKVCTQSIIAPIFLTIQGALEGLLPFNSAKNGWRIQVLIGDKVVRVTHMKQECATKESEETFGVFNFDWNVDFILDSELLEVKEMTVALTNVFVSDQKKGARVEGLLRTAFERFQPKSQDLIHIPIQT